MLRIDSILQNGVVGSLAFFFLVLGAIFYVVSIDKKTYYPSFPSNLGVTNEQSSFRRWISSLRFLVQGRALLINAYVPRKTYVVPTPKNYYVFISSEKNIKEYASSPIFSLHAAYDDLFAYKYNKLWWDEGEDVNNTQSFYFKILRVGLTTKLPVIYPIMTETMSKVLSSHLSGIRANKNGWRSIQHYPLIAYTTTSVIGPIFFGQKLWSEPEFQDAARNYPAQYFALGEMIQHVPTWTVPLLKTVVTRRGKYRRILIKYLLPLVNEYMNGLEDLSKTDDGHSFANIVQYAVAAGQGKSYWTPKRVVLFVDSLWRSAIHSVPLTLTHAVNSLCENPEYIQPLRDEIENQPITDHNILENLPLLNSFLKETLRTRPLDSVSTRRKALQSYTFSDGGPHVPVGNVVCVPSYNIMNDHEHYPNPSVFNGFRFAPTANSKASEDVKEPKTLSKVTDISPTFPFWGNGTQACPGRFFASFQMKGFLAHLLTTYDFKLANENRQRTWHWRTFILPVSGARLLIREREGTTG
ncbi:hypothetical protein MMC11_001458 [Xylographa trunciseda]|nr:hypothetical protein [Xylographa trunciseda]